MIKIDFTGKTTTPGQNVGFLTFIYFSTERGELYSGFIGLLKNSFQNQSIYLLALK